MTPPSQKGVKVWHPYHLLRDKEIQLTEEERLETCVEYLDSEASADFCTNRVGRNRNRSKKKFLGCKCLHVLRGQQEAKEAVSRYMLHFFAMGKSDKQRKIYHWIRISKCYVNCRAESNKERTKLVYLIPFMGEEDEDGDEFLGQNAETCNGLNCLRGYRVCKSAISAILDLGVVQWETCEHAEKRSILPVHGNVGQRGWKGKRFDSEVMEDLQAFVAENTVGSVPREKSTRQLYKDFCIGRGWIVETTARGTTSVKRQEGQDGIDAKSICSWSCFHRCYSNIVIKK